MKTFNDLVFEMMHGDNKWNRAHLKFDNGYGASVVRGPHSYGGQSGLYELAVLDSDGEITYGTHITDDVLGFLTPEDVTRHMIEIQELPIEKIEKQTIKSTNKMNTLKLVRVIAVGTAVLAGILSVCILIFPSKALDMGVTDNQFLFTIIIFLISTLYWLAIDAMIRRDEAETDAMKKIHQTTFNQAVILMVISVIGTLSLVFL